MSYRRDFRDVFMTPMMPRSPHATWSATAALAEDRNRFVTELAVAVVHAGKGSRTEEWCRMVLGMGKAVWTLDAAENGHLVEMGATVIDGDGLPEFFLG